MRKFTLTGTSHLVDALCSHCGVEKSKVTAIRMDIQAMEVVTVEFEMAVDEALDQTAAMLVRDLPPPEASPLPDRPA